MSNPERPFSRPPSYYGYIDRLDRTIWDPFDVENAIVDPKRGPGVLTDLLMTPPYPREDGTFFVFGAHHLCGTNDFDAEGRPFIRELSSSDIVENAIKDFQSMRGWIEQHESGLLPDREDMSYPVFRYADEPYIVDET